MLTGTYEATLDTPLGEQHAVLTLEEQDKGDLCATLSTPALGTSEFSGTYKGNGFEADGSIRILFKRIDFTAKGTVKDDKLSLDVTSKGKTAHIVAKRTDTN